jgi:hypothetical protein
MNIEARKIEFIQEFLKLQSEEAISKFEKILQKEKNHSDKRKIEPMSVQEMNRRIDKSMEDSDNGRLTEANDLLAEIEKWN